MIYTKLKNYYNLVICFTTPNVNITRPLPKPWMGGVTLIQDEKWLPDTTSGSSLIHYK